MRPKDEEKRAAIKEATFAMVAEQGVSALKMAALARRVGISVSTLYVYFEDKEDLIKTLFREVMRSMVAEVVAEFKPQRPYKANLRQVWLKYLDYRVSHYNAIRFYEQVRTSPFAEAAAGIKAAEMEVPLQLIRLGKEQLLLKDMDEWMLLAVLGGITERMTHMFVQGQVAHTEENVSQCFTLLWDSIKA